MSINHYSSSSLDLPETTLWWTHQNPQHHQQQQNIQIMEPIPNPSWPLHHHKNLFNLNNNEEDEEFEDQVQQNEQATSSQEQDGEQQQEEEEEKEPMFEKPLTPSDVGKLNRLVIPKQHAEKYFPLGAASAASASAVTSTTASDSGECKGLLLSFEDESGKCWRFRYSYWNSSQSYVLTKGWSRYVKDKRLDAGDIVSFERHRGDSQRLFIRWRRRSADAAATAAQVCRAGHGGGGGGDGNNNGKSGGGAGGVGWTSGFYYAQPSYPTHHQQQHQLVYQQQHEDLHAGKVSQVLNQRTRPILGNCSSSNSKVLRLFGVNMECQTQQDDDDDSSTTPQCSYNNVVMPSTHGADNNNSNTNHQNLYHINQPPNSYANSHMLHQQPYYY